LRFQECMILTQGIVVLQYFPRRKGLLMSVTYLRGWRTKYIRVQWLKNLMCPFS
jgi:hypothetical protein